MRKANSKKAAGKPPWSKPSGQNCKTLPSMKLHKLELNAFRAATQPFALSFDPSKKLTMIFGENGTGKSTIADAFTCLCTDSIGSLEDKSNVEKKFLTSANCKPADLYIRLITGQDTFSATLSSNKFVKNTSKTYPKLHHLRRSLIAQLTDATPSKRYEVLESYIDVEPILASEEGLRSLLRRLENDLGSEIRSLTAAHDTLEAQWRQEGMPGDGGWKDWADVESDKDLATEKLKAARIKAVLNAWQTLTGQWQEVQEQQRICLDARQEVADAQVNMQRIQAASQSISQDLLKMLDHADRFVGQQSELHQCPLCDQPIEKNTLANRIRQQMDGLKAYQLSVAQMDAAQKAETNANLLLQNLQSKLDDGLEALEIATSNYAGKPVSFGATAAGRLRFFQEKQTSLNAKMAQMEQEMLQSERTLNQHNLIKTQYEAILHGEAKTTELQRLLNAAKAAFLIVESTRKNYQEQELASISGEVDALYQKLHPDENIGKIRLSLKPNAKKSVDLAARFQNYESVTPQSVYSESHLDTLGICVLLALAKKQGGKDTILLLDDVVTSVDERHLDRFIALLHDLQKDFAHIVFTTHYRPWRDRYRFHRDPESQVHFVELRDWKMEDGMRLQKERTQVEELREAMASSYFDRQALAAKAGVLLENLLDFLTTTYACRLRRKPRQDYTLGELLDAVMSKLAKSLRVELLSKNAGNKFDPALPMQEVPLLPHFEELEKLAFIRNQTGAHFTPPGPEVNDADIFAFANHTLSLAQRLTCPETGAFPDCSASGAFWETRSKAIRLFPLQEPG
ncbi:MAG: hypothetical protein EPO28_05100 [Saprospiraceae bacterium]|nr:MAG: hypothetical protein EPO28_05100 [Saprospiraceae bacterium]